MYFEMLINTPRITIAGTGGDSGKTILSCGLASALIDKGYSVAPFKKGPDFIDPAWMKLAAGEKSRNLDTFLMKRSDILSSFYHNSRGKDIAVVEGNRGLYDGFDEKGTHSTAELAKLIESPVILIFSAKKVTRTAAAVVLGMKMLDDKVNIAGVVLNLVAGKRHQAILRNAIENETGIPVIGMIPKYRKADLLPSRHLGLVMPEEMRKAKESVMEAGKLVSENVDIDKIFEIAKNAPAVEFQDSRKTEASKSGVKIGYFRDRAFSFYYPENLEALEDKGAELIAVSSIEDKSLPEIDALYIGGGFPETNIDAILKNESMMHSVRNAAEKGLPVYAECGGLIYLTRSLEYKGSKYPMADVFPVDVEMGKKPRGHGYSVVKADRKNPFFPEGTEIKGHEFHYTQIVSGENETALEVIRGTGCFPGRDGLIKKNVFASYLHIHAAGEKRWAEGFTKAAENYKKSRE